MHCLKFMKDFNVNNIELLIELIISYSTKLSEKLVSRGLVVNPELRNHFATNKSNELKRNILTYMFKYVVV